MNIRNSFEKYGTVLGLLIIIIAFAAVKPNVFPKLRNAINILEQVSLLTILGIAATVVVSINEFDLSLGSVTSFTGILTASLLISGLPIYVVIPVVLMVGFLFGTVNGLLVAKINLLSFITTLASATFLTGVTFWYSGGTIIFSGIPDKFLIIGQGEALGLPIPTLIMIGITFIFWYIFNSTMLGRHFYAIGGNEIAAKYSGIKSTSRKITAFGLASLLSALVGIILTSKLGSAHPTAGSGYLLKSYATVFLGMTVSSEGVPNIPGTIVGALIMGILANGLTLMGVSTYFQDMATGMIIIFALILQKMGGPGE